MIALHLTQQGYEVIAHRRELLVLFLGDLFDLLRHVSLPLQLLALHLPSFLFILLRLLRLSFPLFLGCFDSVADILLASLRLLRFL